MKADGFADLHQHVLWGLDDGPATAEQMHRLLRQDAEEGIRLVFATSHGDFRHRCFDMALYCERLAEANAYCESVGWQLRLLPGCEIYYTPGAVDHLKRHELPTLGNSRHVLIEFSPDVPLERILGAADGMYRAGYLPILAHVERYRCLVHAPERAARIREEYGLLYQMNCGTVLHPGSFWRKRFVRRMLDARAIDAIATDAHDAVRYPPCMQAAYQALARAYDTAYAERLTHLGWKIAEEGPDAASKKPCPQQAFSKTPRQL